VGWLEDAQDFVRWRSERGHRLRKQQDQWQSGLKVLVRMGKEVQSQVQLELIWTIVIDDAGS